MVVVIRPNAEPAATSVAVGDIFLIDGATGVRALDASKVVIRSAAGNVALNNSNLGYRSTATAAGTTTLTIADTYMQWFTGATTQTVVLPDVTTLALGHQFFFRNLSTGIVTVQSSGGNVVTTLAGNTEAVVTCIAITGTGSASWSQKYNATVVAIGKGPVTFANSLNFTGTDATTQTFPTTSATLARTDAGQTFTGAQVISGAGAALTIQTATAAAFAVGLNGATNPAFQVDTSTALQTAGLKVTGAATGGVVAVAVVDSATNSNLSINAKGNGSITLGNNATNPIITIGGLGGGSATINLGVANNTPGIVVIAGGTSGSTTLVPTAVASGTLTLPAATDTLIGKATTDILTNKTYDTAGAGNVFKINGNTISSNTGTGAVNVLATAPTINQADLVGTTTNNNANAGSVGELIKSDVAIGSAVALSTGVVANLTSISLTAGDWDVSMNAYINPAVTTSTTVYRTSISQTSATHDTTTMGAGSDQRFNATVPASAVNVLCGPLRVSLSGTTTIFGVVQCNFTVSTCSAYGQLRARRVR